VNIVDKATTERLVLVNTPNQAARYDLIFANYKNSLLENFYIANGPRSSDASDVLQRRIECLAGDVHWREVIRFALGGLLEQRLDTELTVTLQAFYELDQGEDGAERALRQREARGAMLVADSYLRAL